MIVYLEGVFLSIEGNRAVILSHGVGYEVELTHSILSTLEAPQKQSVSLLVHTIVREDGWWLYGFSSFQERLWFRHLIKISGVGPKLAMVILSDLGLEILLMSLVQSDAKVMQSVSGLGKKTAERLLVELSDKAIKYCENETILPLKTAHMDSKKIQMEAKNALMALGYRLDEANKRIEQALLTQSDFLSTESLIKAALFSISNP